MCLFIFLNVIWTMSEINLDDDDDDDDDDYYYYYCTIVSQSYRKKIQTALHTSVSLSEKASWHH